MLVQAIQTKYDIILTGAGLAGLSLAYRALRAGIWADQRILVIDEKPKNENDRTWSFWQSKAGYFDTIISKSWHKLSVFSNIGEEISLDTGDYLYHTIYSLDFYNSICSYLAKQGNVTFAFEKIHSVINGKESCLVSTDAGNYTSKYVFNSIFQKPELKTGAQYFLQHFKGLKIKVPDHGMDIDKAYLMDFRTAQEAGTSFFYTLPLNKAEIFVEYTVFSKSLLDTDVYDNRLSEYMVDVLKISNFEILSEEFGVIPMTDHKFKRFDGNVINIGTIGGDTRGATGYTFTNVQETVSKIIGEWKRSGTPLIRVEHIGRKQLMYDGTLLNVLNSGDYKGHQLFTDLFRYTRGSRVFRFLDADQSLANDFMIIKSLKPWPFVKAITGYLYRKIKYG